MESFFNDIVPYTIGFCFGWWACKSTVRKAALRDYFAAAALTERGSTFYLAGLNKNEALDVAVGCFVMADAMLAARRKP